jgi:transcriptional regulator with XRE-family HTH domain
MSTGTHIRSSQQLGKLIAVARRQKKLSQREVATQLGVTQAWISKVERGQQKAWIGQVLRLVSWLEIDLVGRLPGGIGSDSPANAEYSDIDKILSR